MWWVADPDPDRGNVHGALVDELSLVIAGGDGAELLELTEAALDGLIANDKFCCTRRVRLSLSWWRKPLSQRGPVLQAEPVRAEDPYDADMDCLPPVRFAPRGTAPAGSGVPVAGAPGSRAGGRGLAGGADHSGGAWCALR